MTVPPPTRDDLSPVPEGAEFDEPFWRRYAIDVADYRTVWVDDLLEDQGVAGLVAELGTAVED